VTPSVGHLLYASCSAEYYGEIVAVGEDANGQPTIDIRVEHTNDLIDCESVEPFTEPKPGEWANPLTTIELPEGVRPILRHVQWRPSGPDYPDNIICNTPGNGCFRCTKLFTLHKERASWVT